MMPDIRAEILLGATGWASGSQMCSGMIPALTPKPAKNNKKTAAFKGSVNVALDAAKLEKSSPPAREFNSKNPSNKQPVPACDMTKKRTPALRVASSLCSKLIKQ